MSKTDILENGILNLIFKNLALANIGDASGLQPAATSGNFFIALFQNTAVPTDSYDGIEASYTGYSRIAVNRTTGWTVGSGQAVNSAPITFPPCSGGSAQTMAYFAIYTASSGGDRLFYGSLQVQLLVAVGVTPEFSTGALVVIED